MTYSNLHAQMLEDKDNDGVEDFADMDTDNDGIMDADEGVECETVELESLFPDEFGLLLGVNSNDPSQTLAEIYTFSQLVCDFSVTVWDLDRTDAIIVTGRNGGITVPFTLTNVGGCIDDSMLPQISSACNNQVEPGDGNILDHVFTLQFDGCIDELEFDYFDLGPGNGGSFTFVPTPFPTCLGPDTDGDGIPDAQDLDSDNDGIPDAIEACGTKWKMEEAKEFL